MNKELMSDGRENQQPLQTRRKGQELTFDRIPSITAEEIVVDA